LSDQSRELDKLGSARRDCKCSGSCRRYRDVDLSVHANSAEHKGGSFVVDPEPGAKLQHDRTSGREKIIPLLLKGNAGLDGLTEVEYVHVCTSGSS
jgi:hypothetical protein